MASLSFIIGIIGNVISVLVFASPIKTFVEIVKKKSTEEYKGIPYAATLLSAGLWTFYGLLRPGGLLVATVNGAGVLFHLVYVTLFLIYAPSHKKVLMMKLVAALDVAFYGGVIGVTLLAIHGSMRITFVGIICAALSIAMYASPLAAMRNVIRTKSVEYMPFLLSFFLFLNGGIWTTYALIVKDFYIAVPNGLGFIFGSAQLILYGIYKSKSKSTRPMDVVVEEGSAHLGTSDVDDDHHHQKKKIKGIVKGVGLPKDLGHSLSVHMTSTLVPL